jgi:serine/threonine protein kinase
MSSRVKELFLAACERRPEERQSYLDEACGDDDELRHEIESLLIEHDRQSAEAGPPGSPPASPEPADDPPSDPLVGRTLGRYRILGVVGKGGMGTVYEAEDPDLRRKVALKVLPAAVAGDPKRLERFKREARSVAALSHPNVVTLHSVEEEGDTHFLTMELVQGEPLDRLIPDHGLDLGEILVRATQLAEGLRAAHEQGIIHRDLKPANVIVDTEGRLRILDFGLAKAQPARPDSSHAETSLDLTVQGTVLGTAPYMSPKQVEGKPLDRRSDIFSLGSILYEMATGRWPFPGETVGKVMSAILRDEPTLVTQLRSDLPEGLERIVSRCLEKDPAKRYQSARELRDALAAMQPAVSSASLARATPPRYRGRRWAVAVAAVVAVVAAVAVLSWLRGRQSSEPPAVTSTRLYSSRPITSSGLVTGAAISPDGKYVAYSESYQGRQSLHLRQLGSAQSLELIPPAPARYWTMTFTLDSTDIVFGRKDRENPLGALFQISALGGAERRLVERMDSSPSFSPDGSRFTWLRADFPTPGASALMIANADGSDEQVLATRTLPEVLAPRFFTAPSWSPDGSLIAASVMSNETRQGKIVGFDVETGAVAWTSEHPWRWIGRVEWLPDGDALLAIGAAGKRPDFQIWYVPYPRGAPHQITGDLFQYRLASLTADGNSLVTVAETEETALWAHRRDGTGRRARISLTRMDGRFGFDLTADGRIVLQTVEAGQMELAVMNLDGSRRQLLTDGPLREVYPRVTAKGKVVYCTWTPGSLDAELRQMEIDGTDSQLLSTLRGRYITPALSPDGDWAVIPKASGLWRLPLDGGEPTQLTDFQAYLPAISPQGTRLAFYFENNGQERIGIIPIGGGELEVTLDGLAHTATSSSLLRWTEDGEALIINTTPGDRSNLWRLPLDGSEPQRLTDFTDERLFWFEYSPDGETLVVSSGHYLRDAMLIRDFR